MLLQSNTLVLASLDQFMGHVGCGLVWCQKQINV
jgi:hypothetical protein